MGKKRKPAVATDGRERVTPTSGERTNGVIHKTPNEAKYGPKAGVKARQAVLACPVQSEWHASTLPPIDAPENATPPPKQVLDAVQQYAVSLLEAENTAYSARHVSSSSSNKFMSTIMTSGTLEDKVSALTLQVQESPLHTMKALETLVGLSRKKSRNHALMALGAVKDLLGQGAVLPTNRKLRYFQKEPGLHMAFSTAGKKRLQNWTAKDGLPNGLQPVHLVTWAYEDWLKRTYFELLRVIEHWCNDEIEFARTRALTFAWELLRDRPEQEENLLRLVVNKLGDSARKVASRASHLLLQLQNTHPLMKSIVLGAIESELLFRPGQSAHAKYYAIITLNQTILGGKDQAVANKLLDIYFSLFVSLLKMQSGDAVQNKPGESDQGGGGKPGRKANQKTKLRDAAHKSDAELSEKMIAQVLTGVNRAFPYADTDEETFTSNLDTVYRITHSSNFNTSIQALTLLQQISSTRHHTSDRFYRTLYESLLDPRLLASSKQIMYLNLIYRALKADINTRRVQAFVKRLLQVASSAEPPFTVGVLCLVRELGAVFPNIRAMVDQAEEDDSEEKFVDVPSDAEDGSAQHMTSEMAEAARARYDGRKRDPAHSNADRSCLWELLSLKAHYHPTVHLYANALMHPAEPRAADLARDANPSNHTLIHFLDRFAYRNPKSAALSDGVSHGSSIMQPLAGAKRADMLFRPAGSLTAGADEPVNTAAFWDSRAGKVGGNEEIAFFQTYFERAGKGPKAREKKRKARDKKRGADSDDEEADDEEEVWKALVRSRPEVEDDDASADGDGFEPEEMDFSDESDEEGPRKDGGVELAEFASEDMGDDQELDGEAEDQEDQDGFAELESGDDALRDSDEEVPGNLPTGPSERTDAGRNEEGGEGGQARKKRRKLKHLPLFASAEDYAQLLDQEDDAMS